MCARQTGTFVTTTTAGERVDAYVPRPLPPEPPLDLTGEDLDLLEKANRALGRLDGLATMLQETSIFLYLYVKKEAVLSSQIEGTQSSLSDLLLYESDEAPNVPLEDVEEVSSYVAALEHGIRRLREGFPLSLRLLREIHAILLSHGRGSDKVPGEFRRSQNWIGGTRPGNALFVPPPPDRVMECMGALEKFFHDEPVRTPVLIKAALVHVQFETIHPFLDGNGRLGRLLIPLLLYTEKALNEPILYLSLYFKTHRATYYELLQRVRLDGDWEGWLRFFLEGVSEVGEQVLSASRSLLALFAADRRRIEALGRPAGSALQVHDFLRGKPIVSIAEAAEGLGLSRPTVSAALDRMRDLEIVREITGRKRDRLFVYGSYLDALNEATEPLGS
jgi:Fic family protein